MSNNDLVTLIITTLITAFIAFVFWLIQSSISNRKNKKLDIEKEIKKREDEQRKLFLGPGGVAPKDVNEAVRIAEREGRNVRYPTTSGVSVIRLIITFFVIGSASYLFTRQAVRYALSPTPSLSYSPTENQVDDTRTPSQIGTKLPASTATSEHSFATITPTFPVFPGVDIQPPNVSQVVELGRIDKISVIDMAWNDDWLIDAGARGISFIDPKTMTIMQKVDLAGEVPLAMTVSPSTGTLYVLFNDKIKIIDIQAFTVIQTFSPITSGSVSLAVSPDGKVLGLGIADNKTQILDASDGGVIRNLRSNYGGKSVAFSPDAKYIASGTSQGILMWETATGIWVPIKGGNDKTIRSLAFSNSGEIIAGGGDNFIFIWNIEGDELIHEIIGEFGTVNSIDFSPDDTLMISGTDDGIVRVWDVRTGKPIKDLLGHSSEVLSVCFSPNGQYIASGAIEGSIRLWGLP